MPVRVTIRRILKISNPLDAPPWDTPGEILTRDMVDVCLEKGVFEGEPIDAGPATAWQHAARIAKFVVDPPEDPIHLDLGVNAPLEWIISDGNHRLYAAVLRGDEEIMSLISGSFDRSIDILGVAPDLDVDHDGFLLGAGGELFEIHADGKTVWVNGSDGMCIGRFSGKGVDIHADAETQIREGRQCLDCIHDLPHPEAWEAFRAGLQRHYGVDLPDCYRPGYARPSDIEDCLPCP